jgi:hypothetical protein
MKHGSAYSGNVQVILGANPIYGDDSEINREDAGDLVALERIRNKQFS